MLDIKFIRQNPEKVKEGCQKKRVKIDIDRFLEIDRQRKETIQALELIRAQKNQASKEIAQLKESNQRQKIILKTKELDRNSDRMEEKLKGLEEEFNNLMYQIPNLPFDEVPVGKDDSENVVLRQVGERTKFNFESKDYLEIAEKIDLIDTKRAAKTSGSRFGFLKGEAALMEFALIRFVMDILTKENFIPVVPPVMLKKEMMMGMGYLQPGGDEETYYLPKDDLYLVATSEQSIGAMHANETFQEKDLPRRYVGFSTCFRREAGSYGKDTKGILRVHQFDKIEMFSFVKPEDSKKEHQFLLSQEEKLMKALKLPYQVINICTGDLGMPAAAKYDIEVWIPSQKRYRETHSTSNCTDFQARRLNIRYQKKDGKLEFVHTLNGTAFAIGRILIAIIENYQQKDGSIKVPEALWPYLGFKVIQ